MLPATGSGDFSPLLQTELVLDLATQKGCQAELTWVVVSWVSHNTTCHPAVVTFPPLPQMSLVLDLATPVGCKAELTWGCDQLYVDLVCGCVQWFVKSAALAVWSIETGDKPSAGHPHLVEPSTVLSPFHMEAISYHTAGLVDQTLDSCPHDVSVSMWTSVMAWFYVWLCAIHDFTVY